MSTIVAEGLERNLVGDKVVPTTRTKKIIVAEDDDLFRDFMVSYLVAFCKEEGINAGVYGVSNAKELIDCFYENSPDFVLTDCNMPENVFDYEELNGLDALRTIDAIEGIKGRRSAKVMITLNEDAGLEAMTLGAGYINKAALEESMKSVFLQNYPELGFKQHAVFSDFNDMLIQVLKPEERVYA